MGGIANGIIAVFKKETFEEIKKACNNVFTYEDLMLCFIANTLDEDDKPLWYLETYKDIFTDFFSKDFKNCSTVNVDNESFNKYYKWLESKLKDTTLFELANNVNKTYNDFDYFKNIIDTYNMLKKHKVDFDKEIALIEHTW